MTLQTKDYQQIAAVVNDILLDTDLEHLPVACSLFLRLAHGLAVRNGNMQIGRFMDAAGIPSSASASHTKRSD